MYCIVIVKILKITLNTINFILKLLKKKAILPKIFLFNKLKITI